MTDARNTKEDPMAIPFNAPGGWLEELLNEDWAWRVIADLQMRGEYDWDFADVLDIIPPINNGPQAILDWRMRTTGDEFDRRFKNRLNGIENQTHIVDLARLVHGIRTTEMEQRVPAEHDMAVNAYLRGGLMPTNPLDLMGNQIERLVDVMDSVMSPHERHEIVFRGVDMTKFPETEGGFDQSYKEYHASLPRITLAEGDQFENAMFASTSTIMNLPANFCSIDLDFANSTILQIEITPQVKTLVCNPRQNEIVIERNAVFEVMEVWHHGLHIDGRELKQFAIVRAHPPGTTLAGRSHRLL